MNAFQREKRDLKNADGDLKSLTEAYKNGAIDWAEFTTRAREAGAFEAEIDAVLKANQ